MAASPDSAAALPDSVDALPDICGSEGVIEDAVRLRRSEPVFLPAPTTDAFAGIDSAFAIALHMHQPLIPAGPGGDLRAAGLIGNLQYMDEHRDIGDNHNAPAFRWCYGRMGQFIPQLLNEGLRPRVMLEYSGTLLHGLQQMGADDVLEALDALTGDARYRSCVEWLGCPWGHCVAPSTPVQDFRLHVRAWQHHFAALFGLGALGRVRGFSPSEMALPNHPDVAYKFVRTLTDCGYEWVLVQEHTVEEPDGRSAQHPHVPNRLDCTNSRGETASILALIKTQGSDSKLVGQMQPYYEARTLPRQELAGRRVPPLVTQIADGENGGVMMNEFPPKYFEVIRECSGRPTSILNGTEYVERIHASGIRDDELPAIQPLFQHRIWQRMNPGDGPDRLGAVIEQLSGEDPRFHMEGGSWTNELSWVRGYENLLIPMRRASSEFHERVLRRDMATSDPRYRRALFHLLISETSCYRYWGEGLWTDYGAELARRARDIIGSELGNAIGPGIER
jgi:hypothetical protein